MAIDEEIFHQINKIRGQFTVLFHMVLRDNEARKLLEKLYDGLGDLEDHFWKLEDNPPSSNG